MKRNASGSPATKKDVKISPINPRQGQAPVDAPRRDEGLAQLLSAKGTLEMTVRGEDSEWKASVPLGEGRPDLQLQLRELLLQLHNEGLAEKVSGSQEKVATVPGPARAPSRGIVLDVGAFEPELTLRGDDGVPLEGMDSDMLKVLKRARRGPVHTLLGLHCFSHPEWTCKLLEAVAPHLEVLEMEDPDPEHVQVLSGMPALRKLRLQGGELWDDAPPLPPQLEHVYLHRASLDQVLSLQRMPRLRSLTLGYSPWKVFPPLPPHHCGLEYLNILGTRRSPTDDHILFSLIRAHSATLQELRIWTGTCKPTNAVMSRYCFYDDLGPRLAQCNLRSLKWLVLTRSSPLARKGSKEELSHCDKACKVQLQSIVDALKQSGAETAVLCSVCHKHRLKQSDFPHDDLLVPGLHHLPEGRLFRFPSKEIAGILESLERVSIPSSDLIQYMDQFTNLLKKVNVTCQCTHCLS